MNANNLKHNSIAELEDMLKCCPNDKDKKAILKELARRDRKTNPGVPTDAVMTMFGDVNRHS